MCTYDFFDLLDKSNKAILKVMLIIINVHKRWFLISLMSNEGKRKNQGRFLSVAIAMIVKG